MLNKKIDLIEIYGIWVCGRQPVPFFKQIENISEKHREILRSITSNDLMNIRKDVIW